MSINHLNIQNKQTGDKLSAAEFNSTTSKINEVVDGVNASATGGKIGSNGSPLKKDSNGRIIIPMASSSSAGAMSASDKSKLDGINPSGGTNDYVDSISNEANYTANDMYDTTSEFYGTNHKINTRSISYTTSDGSTHTFTHLDTVYKPATASTTINGQVISGKAGLLSPQDKQKLDMMPRPSDITSALSGKADKQIVVLVTRTQQGSTYVYSASKTFTEISTAIGNGTNVILQYDGNYYHLSYSTRDYIVFTRFADDYYMFSSIEVNSHDEWSYSSLILQEELTIDSTPTSGSSNPISSGGVFSALRYDGNSTNYVAQDDGFSDCIESLDSELANKQDTLVSGTNIKTVNNNTLLGIGNIDVKELVYGKIQDTSFYSAIRNPRTGNWAFSENAETPNEKKIYIDILTNIIYKYDADVGYVQIGGGQIKTINGQSLIGSGDVTLDSEVIAYDGNGNTYFAAGDSLTEGLDSMADAIDNIDLPEGLVTNEDPVDTEEEVDNINLLNSIDSITTTESQSSGGNNVVTIVTTDGTTTSFSIKNGIDGVSLGEAELINDLTTGGATKVLSAEMGKVLGGEIDSIFNEVSETIPFTVSGIYIDNIGIQHDMGSSFFLTTSKIAIPEHCDRVRVITRATTTMCAIAFFESVYVIPEDEGWLIVGEGQILKEYDAPIPEGANYVVASSYDPTGVHDGVSCVCYNSKNIPQLLSRIEEVEERVDTLEKKPDALKALNPLNIELTETGYYESTGGPNSNTKGAHSELVDIRGYERCMFYGNISGRVLVFFDSNEERLTNLDVTISSTTQQTVNLSAKIDGGAVYMAFNCYNTYSDFSSYWCKVDVQSALTDKVATLEEQVNTLIPSFKKIELTVSGQYIDVNGHTVAHVEASKHTGRVNIEDSYDRVRVQTCVYSSMCAIAWYDNNGAFISESAVIPSAQISHSTQVWDVAIPSTAKYFISCTHIKESYKCIMYDSTRWEDEWIDGVLVLGDSISDNGLQINTSNGTSTTYKLQSTAENRGGRWQIDLAANLCIKDLRSYAASGGHWCDFTGATSRQQLSEQISLAIADSINPNGIFLRDLFSPDIIIIALGTNDAYFISQGDTEMGSVASAMSKSFDSLDATIFCDAVRKWLEALRTKWPTAKIYCSLPLQRQGNANDVILSIISPMTELCRNYGVRVINSTYESGICQSNFNYTLADGLHPNLDGQAMLADTILRQVR